jgi:CheY-like chemotaxis protein
MTSCVDCGAEQEIVDIMLPDLDGISDAEYARQEDQTAHRPECPSQERVDMDKLAEMAKAHEEAVAAGKAESDDWLKIKPMLPPSKEVEWKTGPALVILHPQKYQPLMTAPSAEAQETMGEIPEADDDKILEFPLVEEDFGTASPPSAGLV